MEKTKGVQSVGKGVRERNLGDFDVSGRSEPKSGPGESVSHEAASARAEGRDRKRNPK